jgi:tetratricopeptide (TPR) repeat protein
MAQIGSVHYELSNWELAMEYLAEAERLQLGSVGALNRDTLETQALIGRVLSASGNFEEALLKLNAVYERQSSLFSSKHPTIADTLSYIGDCFLDQGMATEARGQYVDCYNMRKQFFTVDQIHIAESMVDIIRARSGQPERALQIYQNAHDVYKEYLPDDHVQIGKLRVYEGDSYTELLQFTTAIERYEQAKQIFHKAYGGECNINSAAVLVNIGLSLLRKCDYVSAKKSFSSALTIYQQILPDGHVKIQSTLNDLDRVEQEEALCV